MNVVWAFLAGPITLLLGVGGSLVWFIRRSTRNQSQRPVIPAPVVLLVVWLPFVCWLIFMGWFFVSLQLFDSSPD